VTLLITSNLQNKPPKLPEHLGRMTRKLAALADLASGFIEDPVADKSGEERYQEQAGG